MLKTIFSILLLAIGIVYLSQNLLTEPWYEKPENAVNSQFKLIPEFNTTKDTLDIHLHYKNVEAHMAKPFFQNLSYGLLYRDDYAIEQYYTNYTNHQDSRIADLGHLCKTMIYNRQDNVPFADKELNKIKNTNIPYYPSELAYQELRYGNSEKAIQLFQQELKRDPNNTFSIKYLAITHYLAKDYTQLASLYSEERKEILKDFLNEIYLTKGMIPEYLSLLFERIPFNWINILAAFLVAAVWLIYLNKVSIFESFPTMPALISFAIGLVFTFATSIFYDAFQIYFHIRDEGSAWSQFFFCFAGIGLIEETTKFIPVLISIALFKNRINTPLGYVSIACSSALAFASLENTLYFEYYQGDVIYTRAFLCIAGHMFYTCLIVYGYKIISFPSQKSNLKYGALFFLAAILNHGFYDAFLMVPNMNEIWPVSYVIAIFEVYGLFKIIQYALNISPDFTASKTIPEKFIKRLLLIGFSGILLFEFVLNSMVSGHSIAYDILITSLLPFLLLLSFWVSSLSDYNLVQHLRTGIFSIPDRFSFYDLTNKQLKISTVSSAGSLPEINEINSYERIQISQKGLYILLHSESGYQGHEWLILQPIHLNSKKDKRYFDGNLYAVKNESNFLTESFSIKDIIKLGKSKVSILNDPPLRDHWTSKLGTASVFGIILLGIFIFVQYMNFRSARIGYQWTTGFLEIKSMYKAGNNVDYALRKDPDFEEAKFLKLKLLLYVNEYEKLLSLSEEIKPSTARMKSGIDYMKVRSYLALNKKSEAYSLLKDMTHKKFTVNDSAYYWLAQLHWQRKLFNESLTTLAQFEDSTSSSNATSPAKLRLQAQCYVGLEQYPKALSLFQQYEKKEIHLDGEFFGNIARCYIESGDTVNACIHWNKGLALSNPESIVEYGHWCHARETQNDTLNTVK